MRRIINSTYVSVDGVIQNPQDWPSTPGDEETSFKIQNDLLSACDAVLMGRHTYESFSSVWAGKSGGPYTDRINSMTKYVVSSTLPAATWENTTIIRSDAINEIKRLKEQPGGDIVEYGFGSLSYALMERGLLDELRLWVHPFFVGASSPDDLLSRKCPTTQLDLAGVQTLKSGVVILTYSFK
ncbi:MAG TPA: dihydrofolate reductase family protein [Gemmatimonadaceae bacterium]|nr:dihydrofolate reductase family protein [Gemmatimonadaceae bacterium]